MPGDGIRLESTKGNTWIYNNTVTGCDSIGVRMLKTEDVALYDNILTNNQYGIGLTSYSKHNKIFNNTINKTNSMYGFYIDTRSLNNSIPINNTVNGEWLRYFYNLYGAPSTHQKVENLLVQEPRMANLGQIIIANSTYVDIMNNTAENGRVGIALINVHNSYLLNNTAKDNVASIGHGFNLLMNSENNTLEDNLAQDNRYGIGILDDSINNKLWQNTIYKPASWAGLFLDTDGSVWNNIIPQNNTVENTSIQYYFQNPNLVIQNLSIETPRMTNLGQLVIVSSAVTLENLKLINGYKGLYLNQIQNGSLKASELSENVQNNIYCVDTSNLTIEYCTFTNSSNPILLQHSSPQIINSTIDGTTNIDIQLTGLSEPVLINTTFNKTSVDISPYSNLTVKWYLHVLAESNGRSVTDALVSVKNSTDALVQNLTTNVNGSVRDLILTEYVNSTDNITFFTPHTLNVTKSGYSDLNIALTMNSTREVNVTLIDGSAPALSAISIEPSIIGTSTNTIWLNATIDDGNTGRGNITYAEWLISSTYPGIANGVGEPMNSSDGAFDEVVEAVTAVLDISDFSKGDYTIWVHGKDEADNWCDWANVSFTITDNEGPTVTAGPTLDPEIVGTSLNSIWLTATLDDTVFGDSDIVEIDLAVHNSSLPVPATIVSSITVLDGTLDESRETVTVAIDISLWEVGDYTLGLRGRDAFDNWGPWGNITFEIIDDEAPSVPTGLAVIDAYDVKLALTWNPNTELDLAGYNVYRSVWSGSSYQLVATLDSTNSSWQDSGLENDRTYYYVITAFDDAPIPNESVYSEEASALPTKASTSGAGFWGILILILVLVVVLILVLLFLKSGRPNKTPDTEDTVKEMDKEETDVDKVTDKVR
jgi:parallel beta-helix repeat protein